MLSYAVWLYFRFPLGLRKVEELLAVRGIEATYGAAPAALFVDHRSGGQPVPDSSLQPERGGQADNPVGAGSEFGI